MATRNLWNTYKNFEGVNIWGTPAFAGAAVGAIDLSGIVPGTDTDGSLFKAGTNASPIVFSTANQFGFKYYLEGTAITGKLTGFLMQVKASNASGNLDLCGFNPRAQVLTGIDTGTGGVTGIHTELEAGGTAVIGGQWRGHLIELYGEAGATITGDIYGLSIANYIDSTIANYMMARFEHNGSATCRAGLAMYGAMTNAFLFGAGVAGDIATDKSGGGAAGTGYLTVEILGVTRYIQLYT
jgi:hypothetical protein